MRWRCMIATMIRLHTEHLGGQDSGEGWPSDPHVQAASDFIWHPSVTHLLDSISTWDAGLHGTALHTTHSPGMLDCRALHWRPLL